MARFAPATRAPTVSTAYSAVGVIGAGIYLKRTAGLQPAATASNPPVISVLEPADRGD